MNILNILQKKNTKANKAIWFMRQAGRYLPEYRKVRAETKGFLDLCYNPDLACEVTLQPLRRFDLDAAIIFSDILVIPDSMGIKVAFAENAGPLLEPIKTSEELEKSLAQKNEQKLEPVYKAIKQTRAILDPNKALIGFAGGAWTIASYVVEGKISKDLSIIKATYYNDPSFFKKLIDNLVQNIANHLIKQVEAGANILQIFDSWAGLLVGKDYEQLIIKPTNEIIKIVKKAYPNVPIICFPRGSSFQYEKFCAEVDCSAIGVDQYTPLSWIKNHANGKVIQGNLDPLVLLSNSTDLIKQRADDILETMEGTSFIFNLGHGMVPQIKPENVEFLVNYIRSN